MNLVNLQFTADTGKAQKKVEELTKSMRAFGTSIVNAKADLPKLSAGTQQASLSFSQMLKQTQSLATAYAQQKAYHKSTQAASTALKNSISLLTTEIERQKTSAEYLEGSYAALSKGAKQYAQVAETLLNAGASKEQVAEVRSMAASYSELAKQAKAAEAAEESVKKTKDSSEALANVYHNLGDEVRSVEVRMESLKKQYEALYKAGKQDTDEAKNLASEYKKLSEEHVKLTHTTTSVTTRIKNLVKNFVSAQMIVWAIRSGINLIRKAFTKASQMASQAEETANLFSVVFSKTLTEAGEAVDDFSRRLGLARSSAQDALATAADLGYGFGMTESEALDFAKQTTQLVLDLESFKNISGDSTENIKTFITGLTGATRNLLRYGIVVKQADVNARLAAKGLDKLTGSALENAKIQERLNIAIEQSPKALGDMERTMDSTENVTRRLNEQNKQLWENIGKGINTYLTPLKRAILDIVSAWNKATLAQEEYANGNKIIQVYDIAHNADDAKKFAESLMSVSSRSAASDELGRPWYDAGEVYQHNRGWTGYVVSDMELFQTLLKRQVTIFGATTTEQVVKALQQMNVEITDEVRDIIENIIEEVNRGRNEIETIAARQTKISSTASSASSYLDSLAAITGTGNLWKYQHKIDVEGNIPTTAESEEFTKDTVAIIAKNLTGGIEEAIKNVTTNDWKTFLSPLDVALGDVTAAEGLKAQAESIKSVYEVVYNEAIKDGTKIDEAEQEHLDTLLNGYVRVKNELTAITEEQGKAKQAASEWASLIEQLTPDQYRSSLDRFQTQQNISAMGDNAQHSTLTNLYTNRTLNLQSADAIYQQLVTAAAGDTQKLNEANKAYSDTINSIIDLYDAEIAVEKEKIAAEEAYAANVKATTSRGIGWLNTPMGNNLNSLNPAGEILSSWQAGHDSVQAKYDSTGKQTNAADQNINGWISAIIAELKKLDFVQDLLSLNEDVVVPILNAFFKPVTPLIKAITKYTKEITVGFLEPLFEPLKTVMEVVIIIGAAVQTIWRVTKFISDLVRTLLINLQRIIYNAIAWFWGGHKSLKSMPSWSEAWSDIKSYWRDAFDSIADIEKMTFSISESLDSGDADIYNDLYQKGFITATQWQELLNGINATRLDTVRYGHYGEYNTYTGSTGQTTINYGGINVTINGSTSLTTKQIEDAVLETLRKAEANGGSRMYA